MTFPWPLSTDQNTGYDPEGTPVACGASGQDAENKSNGTHDDQRFQLDRDTVFDTVTELHWCRNANPFEFPYAWQKAQDCVAGMNRTRAHGRADWRLPERRELFSLLSHQHINPALPHMHPFSGVFPGYYWTATTCSRLPDQAWYVHLGGARVYRGMKKGAYLIWPVAGPGDNAPENGHRFRIIGQKVKDLLTGLYWTETETNAPCSWEDAFGKVDMLNETHHEGIACWRLPNIRELESLIDLSRHSPALPDGHPFKNVQIGYWASTTSAYEPRYAWVLYMQDGAIGVGFKPDPNFSTWAVARD